MSNFKFSIPDSQIESNWKLLLDQIPLMFPSRAASIKSMYIDYEENIALAPASGTEHFHNAFPGGYVDHVLRVVHYSMKLYETYVELDAPTTGFTLEELCFVALHHDLGKIGFAADGEEHSRYIYNDSQWHRENLGVIYKHNDKIPFTTVPHLGLFLLQQRGIEISWNEWQGIMIHDGLYEEGNRQYLLANKKESKLRTSLPHIIHHADMMAAMFEYNRWETAKPQKKRTS